MKIKCAIFDFDGTLFDSMPIWDQIGEIYLTSIGKEPKASLREDVRALSLEQSAVYLKREYKLSQSVEEIMTGINKKIEDYYIYHVLPKPGVIGFLEQMKKAKITMCIATASEKYQIQSALKRCGMEHYFQAIFTCREVGYGKDKPTIYQKAMEYCGADRNTTLVFEDALHAIKTAKTDGFRVVAVYDDSEKHQNRVRELGDYYLSDFNIKRRNK